MNLYEKIKRMNQNYRAMLSKPDLEWPVKVREITTCIHTYLFAQKLTVRWLRQECRIHGKSFRTKFAFYTGLTPKAYIMHHRIEAAKQILQQTEATITAVAISVGFNSLSSFDKAFERSAGIRPSVWKKQNRQDPKKPA